MRRRGLQRLASVVLGLAMSGLAGAQGDGGFPAEIHGLLEVATGSRITDDPLQPDDFLLNDVRFRLDVSHYGDRSDLTFRGDFTSEGGAGPVELDIRQAAITLQLTDWLDLRAGRQVLTWGTGDFVFLNDLFPKDFVSFFIDRQDEFLKAPSNALKLTAYSGPVNVDLVWTPVFAPDRSITGERLSFFNPGVPGLVSATSMGQPFEARRPDRELSNGELAGRLFRNVGGLELSLYGYLGYTKQPLAFDRAANMATHSEMGVYGGSARASVNGGIAHLEGAYYDSDDSDGTDPNVPNSQIRLLAGYERELVANVTSGAQYYVEGTLDHDELVVNAPNPRFVASEFRHTITGRLTHRLRQETLRLSLFGFYSPNDGDAHFRPSMSYKWSDAITTAAGANLMWGDNATFFGQLENGSNLYVRLRYSY